MIRGTRRGHRKAERTKRKGRKEDERPRRRKKEGQKGAGECREHARIRARVYTEKHNVWESSNNAQRPSHNAPGAIRGSGLQHPREPRRTTGTSRPPPPPPGRHSVVFSVRSLARSQFCPLSPFSLVFLSRRSRADSRGDV